MKKCIICAISIIFGYLLQPTANAAGPLQSERYFQLNGGLFDHISPILVPDRNATAINNLTLDDRGELTKRNGYSYIGITSTNSVTGGGFHFPTTGTAFFAVVSGTNVYRTGNTFAGTFSVITGTVVVTNSATNLAQHTGLNDAEIFCNEIDPPFKVTATGNAFALNPSSAPTGAKTCGTYGSYLILGNTTESSIAYPSRVRWSDINNPDSWPILNYIDVEPNDGDKIVSLISFDDSIYIFKKHSIYRMLITGLDGPDAFIIRPISRNVGAWAKNSVRVIPNVGIAFLAQNTEYVLSDNGLNPIGDPIQRTFDSINRGSWANAIGAVYPKRYQYWLAVSTDGVRNSTVLVYDYIQRAWTVYTGLNVNMLEQAEDSTGQNVLISGDYFGNIYKQDIGTADYPANIATAISISYTTADLTFGSPEYTKGYKYLYIMTKADLNAAIDVTLYYDYDSLTPVPLSVTFGNPNPPVYGTAIYGIDKYPATVIQIKRVELNRSAKAIKLNFSASSSTANLSVLGWGIIYQNDDWKE